jgi:hypothetical protein
MKRKYLVAAAAILAAALGIYWLQQWRTAAKRLAEWEAERAEEVLPDVLNERLAWEHGQLTLGQFAELFKGRTGLSVEIDEAGTEQKKPRDIKVTVPRGDFFPEQLLSMVLAPLGLTADIRGSRVVVASVANYQRGRLRTVVYPVPQPKPAGITEDDWQQFIEMNVNGHAVKVPGAIIVVADGSSQRRARLVIDTICELRETTTEAAAEPVTIPPPATGEMEQRILNELDKETNVDFVEMPLKDVIIYLSELHGIPLIVLGNKLREASVSADTPITKKLRGISLRSALHLILKDLELTYAIRDQAIVITTPEDAEWRMRTVAWLIDDELIREKSDFEAIAKLVVSTIDPGCWREFGGPGLIHRVDDRWLVVQQSSAIIEEVGFLLGTLRQMLAAEDHSPSQLITPAHEAEEAIRRALEKPIALDFVGVPLKDAMMYFGEELKLPLVLSIKKLEEALVSPDTPITYKTPPVPAKSVLDKLLKLLELDFVVRDEVLQITTPEDSESQLIVRVYDTRALVARISQQEVQDEIVKTIQPNSWSVAGGPGEAQFYRGLLIVSQTYRVHEDVERLVESLTSAPAEAK